MEFINIIDSVNNISIIGLLLFIIYTGFKGMWVFGIAYSEMKKEKEEWKELALKSHFINEKTISMINK